MSLTLILTRHAKSDWGDPMLPDRDRPLNKRGRRDAPRIGAWLAEQGHIPDQARISAARRTQETWALLSAAFPAQVQTSFHDSLYHADPSTLLDVIRQASAPSQIVIAHNPGIGDTAHRLVKTPPNHARFFDYPTAATLICRFDVKDWTDVTWGIGKTCAFLTPHDL